MSTTATRLPLAEALQEAEAFRALFDGCYERWEFAGSLRRKKSDIGDIEHVVIPKWASGSQLGFFDDRPTVNLVFDCMQKLIGLGDATAHSYGENRRRLGEKCFGVDFHNRLHEVFCCEADNWGCILAIRTGPAEFSKRLVTRLLANGYRQLDGHLHRQMRSNKRAADSWQRISCPDEETFFRAAGYPRVIPPEARK